MKATVKEDRKKEELRRHEKLAKDERGWEGQHGQRPANEEEKNYRQSGRDKDPSPGH